MDIVSPISVSGAKFTLFDSEAFLHVIGPENLPFLYLLASPFKRNNKIWILLPRMPVQSSSSNSLNRATGWPFRVRTTSSSLT